MRGGGRTAVFVFRVYRCWVLREEVCYGLDVVVAGRYPDVWGWHRNFVHLEEGGVVVLRV